MTDTPVLNEEQRARGQALTVARSILLGDAFVFGGVPNDRKPAEFIEIADYIVGPRERTATMDVAWIPGGTEPVGKPWPFAPIIPSESIPAASAKPRLVDGVVGFFGDLFRGVQ